MIVAGLDLSLVKTGIAIVRSDSKVLYSGLVKSKPCGDKAIDELKRLDSIVNEIMEHLRSAKIDLVVIENLAFMARNTTALTQLAGLSYLIRTRIWKELKVPFVLVAPTSLKKFITGSGKGDKSLMMMSVLRDYDFESLDDNECDAYSLAIVGLALRHKPVKPLAKPQTEVINLLKKQL